MFNGSKRTTGWQSSKCWFVASSSSCLSMSAVCAVFNICTVSVFCCFQPSCDCHYTNRHSFHYYCLLWCGAVSSGRNIPSISEQPTASNLLLNSTTICGITNQIAIIIIFITKKPKTPDIFMYFLCARHLLLHHWTKFHLNAKCVYWPPETRLSHKMAAIGSGVGQVQTTTRIGTAASHHSNQKILTF